MSIWSVLGDVGVACGLWQPSVAPLGCTLGRGIYRETRRAAMIANVNRRPQEAGPDLQALLGKLFPELDVARIRFRTECRLPPNRFGEQGWVLAMTFGYSILWRGPFDETKPDDVVNFIHEVVHVDQVRRLGGEMPFACEYGKGYLDGGGELPASIRQPTRYHRNPLEAEAYRFEARFQDERGRAVPDLISELSLRDAS